MRAAPDGYTLGMGNSGTHASSPNLMKAVPYDPISNFSPIGRIGSFIFMLTVNSSVPVNTLPELIAYSKSNPGKLSYAVANSVGMAVMELLKARRSQCYRCAIPQHAPSRDGSDCRQGIDPGCRSRADPSSLAVRMRSAP